MKILRLLILLLSLHSTSAFSLTSKVLSLPDAIFLALRYNPNVQNAEIQRIVDKFSLRAANYAFEVQYALVSAALYTNAKASNSLSSSDTESITPSASLLMPLGTQVSLTMNNPFSHTVPNPRFYNPSLVFTVTQPLIRGFGTDVTLAPLYNALDQEASNKLTFKNQIISTTSQVINQYLQWVQSKSALETQQASLAANIVTLHQYRDLIKAGRSPEAGIVQFEVDVANAQLSVQQQEISLEQARLALLNLLGLDPTYPITPPEKIASVNHKVPTLAESIQLGLIYNVGYQQALIQLRVAKRSLLVARDNTKPQLNLILNRTQGAGSGGSFNSGLKSLVNEKNYNTSVGLNLSVPIDNVPLEQAALNAMISLKQSETTLLATKRQLISDVTNGYNTLIIQKAQIAQSLKAMQLASQNLDIANLKLKLGKITPFEVSSQRIALTNAQLTYINSQMNYISTLASFEQTLGTTLERWKIKLSY